MKRLQLSRLSARLGDVQALDDVSMEVRAGRTTLLVGPNGAGKSTLLRVLLGLVRPDHLDLTLDGKPAAIDRRWKRCLGYLPEAVAFSENLTGGQVLRFFARARGCSKQRVARVLERVGLTQASRRAIRGYSRGMRQRLGLGVAILADPSFLILDEPTSGLDQEGLAVLWSVLSEWRSAGRMTLMTTHDLALMERRVDDVCVLQDGRVCAQGTVDTLRDLVGFPHRVVFRLGNAPHASVDAFCKAIEQWRGPPMEWGDGRLVVEVEPDAILALLEIQAHFADVVSGLRIEEPTLDVVYEALLQGEGAARRRLDGTSASGESQRESNAQEDV